MTVTRPPLAGDWPDRDVVVLPAGAAARLGLPPSARRVLVEVGLPRRLEPLFAVSEPERMDLDGYPPQCRIGTDGGTEICVDLSTGVVRALSFDPQYPSRIVNTGLDGFVTFLSRVDTARRALAGLGPAGRVELLRALRGELARLDPAAMADPEYWWPVLLSELEAGLL